MSSPVCPPIRALTFDVLGLIKVVEARRDKLWEGRVPKVVERWGNPDSSRCIFAASIDDSSSRPLLAVARSHGKIDLLNPLNGQSQAEISIGEDGRVDDDPVVGLHLFRKSITEKSRSCTIFTCTTKGNALLQSYDVADTFEETSPFTKWKVCPTGSVSFCKVEEKEKYAIVGGKGIEINLWNLETYSSIWNAKSPPKDSLGIFTPTWFTCGTFLCKDEQRIVAGTNNHQVRFYDIRAQRRPVTSFDFGETPVKAVSEDLDGQTIYVGNGYGDLALFDLRTAKSVAELLAELRRKKPELIKESVASCGNVSGDLASSTGLGVSLNSSPGKLVVEITKKKQVKLVGGFTGKCSGSIRSIVRHPNLPVVASCGLDGYLRLWDVKSRKLLSEVFLKQHLNGVLFDSNFMYEGPARPAPGDEEVSTTNKRKKVRVDENGQKKGKRSDGPTVLAI
ncbi:hypothetical protein MLD38_039001 [Melastoma candidum]|uniref:Uncharacterized protein n=1 Tax=Melastoma candidum TaxID=119954 RepID=A0ACB9L305_9MYRT|nr:hypothetical protein MLD38_039001 [Melastoma candidum]